MTAAIRQRDTAVGANAAALSISSSGTWPSGALLVGSSVAAWVTYGYAGAGQSITVADNAGQTYTYLNSTYNAANNSYLGCWILDNNTSNTSLVITATFAYSASARNIRCTEISGTNNAGPDQASFPVAIVDPGTGANAIEILLSSYQSSGVIDAVMVAIAGNSGSHLAAGTGFTGGGGFAAGAGFTDSVFESRTVTASGSNNATWTDATDGGTSTYLGAAVIWDSAAVIDNIALAGASGSLGIASLTPGGVLQAPGFSGSAGIALASSLQKLGYGSGSLGIASLFASNAGSMSLTGQSGSMGILNLTESGSLTLIGASGSNAVVQLIGLAALQSRGQSGSLGIALSSAGLGPGIMQAIGVSGSLSKVSLGAFYAVPYVLGLQLSQAESLLLQYGYANVDVDYVYDTVSAPGIVLQQAPLAQTIWPLTAPVTLIVSQGPYVPSTQMPISQLKVTARQFSLEEMVSREWGSSFRAPDHRIYNFTGRAFDSTDIGTTGIYRKNIENAPIVAPPGTTQLANGELILPNGQIIIPGAPPPGGN